MAEMDGDKLRFANAWHHDDQLPDPKLHRLPGPCAKFRSSVHSDTTSHHEHCGGESRRVGIGPSITRPTQWLGDACNMNWNLSSSSRPVVLACIFSVTGFAEVIPHTHQGFFLRGRAGAGWIGLLAQAPYGRPETSNLSTGAGKLELDLGGAISPKLALFGLGYLEGFGDPFNGPIPDGGGVRLGVGFGG